MLRYDENDDRAVATIVVAGDDEAVESLAHLLRDTAAIGLRRDPSGSVLGVLDVVLAGASAARIAEVLVAWLRTRPGSARVAITVGGRRLEIGPGRLPSPSELARFLAPAPADHIYDSEIVDDEPGHGPPDGPDFPTEP